MLKSMVPFLFFVLFLFSCNNQKITQQTEDIDKISEYDNCVESVKTENNDLDLETNDSDNFTKFYFLSLSAGEEHAGVIDQNGNLFTWGSNAYGQLGHSTKEECDAGQFLLPCSNFPEKVDKIPNAKKVVAGNSHTAVIDQNGNLFVFGADFGGELGFDSNETCKLQDKTFKCAKTPKKIMENVKDVAVGDSFTIALKNDGTVWVWGDNTYGIITKTTTEKCGPSLAPFDCSKKPVKIDDLKDIVAVSAGNYFALALDKNGNVFGWGRNDLFQTGGKSDAVCNNGAIDVECIKIPVKISLPEKIQAIDAGADFSLFLSQKGNLFSVGANFYGQLGRKTKDKCVVSQQEYECGKNPQKITIKNVLLFSCGKYHALVKTKGSILYSFGLNLAGELGVDAQDVCQTKYASYSCEKSPVKINLAIVPELISAGGNISLATDKKDVFAWGTGRTGLIGKKGKEDCNIGSMTFKCSKTPVKVSK